MVGPSSNLDTQVSPDVRYTSVFTSALFCKTFWSLTELSSCSASPGAETSTAASAASRGRSRTRVKYSRASGRCRSRGRFTSWTKVSFPPYHYLPVVYRGGKGEVKVDNLTYVLYGKKSPVKRSLLVSSFCRRHRRFIVFRRWRSSGGGEGAFVKFTRRFFFF